MHQLCRRHSRSRTGQAAGFSLIELLIVMALIGIISAFVVPQLIQAFERSRQRRTLSDMRAIAGANGTYRVDFGDYANDLSDLEPDFMNPVPPGDGWGNTWSYASSGTTYSLTSGGRDGASGPAAPTPWYDEPFEADLVLQNGAFTQAPTHQQ